MWFFNCRLKQLNRLRVHSIFLERCYKFGLDYLSTPGMFLFTPFVWIHLDLVVSVYIRRFCCLVVFWFLISSETAGILHVACCFL